MIAQELRGIKQPASDTQSYAQLRSGELRTLVIMSERHTQVQRLTGWQHTLRSSIARFLKFGIFFALQPVSKSPICTSYNVL